MKKSIKKKILTLGLAMILTLPLASSISTKTVNASEGIISYQTHIQNVGWQDWKSDGELSGTTGMSYRLEGIRLTSNEPDLKLNYRTHVENIGWQNFVDDGEFSGTEGQGLRLEAIQIDWEGKTLASTNLYYRVHAQNFGWMGWTKAGERAGTAGYGYRLEAIEVVLLKDNETPEGYEEGYDYNKKNPSYRHIKGWSEFDDGSGQVATPY